MSVNGEIREAFSGRTIDVQSPQGDYISQFIQHFRENYCTPKVQVEKLLTKWDEAGDFTKENMVPEVEKAFKEPLI